RATPDHRWPTQRGTVTDLRVGDVVPAAVVDLPVIPEAVVHGMVFADGNVHELKSHFYHQLRLCGAKAGHLDTVVEATDTVDFGVTWPPFAEGDPVVGVHSDFNMKELPQTNDPAYIASFLRGWVMLDGH